MTVSVDRDASSVTIHTTTDDLGEVPLLITATDNAGHSCTYELTLQTPYMGEGTETDPYKISSAEVLAYLSERVNAGESYSGKYFRLTENIDLKGREWKPIGGETHEFKGGFDGGGNSISNLSVKTEDYGGLFGKVTKETAVLKNITLLSPQVKVKKDFCGALVGYCSARIENCNVIGGECAADSIVGD